MVGEIKNITGILSVIKKRDSGEFKTVEDLREICSYYYDLNVNLNSYAVLNGYGEQLEYLATNANTTLMDKRALIERLEELKSFCKSIMQLVGISEELVEINANEYTNDVFVDNVIITDLLYKNICLALKAERKGLKPQDIDVYVDVDPSTLVLDDIKMLYISLKESNERLEKLLNK